MMTTLIVAATIYATVAVAVFALNLAGAEAVRGDRGQVPVRRDVAHMAMIAAAWFLIPFGFPWR
jgi:hypothetical protein